MRLLIYSVFALGWWSAVLLGQQAEAQDRLYKDPMPIRPLTHPTSLGKISPASIRSFYKSKSEWGHIIDSTWGPGLPLASELALFDAYATALANKFDGFLSLGLNWSSWDSLKNAFRSRINSSTSRGVFASIMAKFAMSLRDAHTFAWDTVVTYTPLSPGVPLLVLYPWATVEHFGAVLTALPDSTALVLRTVPSHPLGLEPGDIVLGYEGVPWKNLVRELLDADLPVFTSGIGAASAESHALWRSAGINWHLFDTIDILKHSTHDTLHLSVNPLISLPPDPMIGLEAMEIPGIPISFYKGWPGKPTGQLLQYGTLPKQNIGYIRLLGMEPANAADAPFAQAIDSLWNSDGIVIDLRWNSGGWAIFDQAFAKMYSQRLTTINDAYRYSTTSLILVAAAHAAWFDIPGSPGSLYERPIAVLLGPTCVSMGDITAQRLRYHPMVRFFGKSSVASHGDNQDLVAPAGWWLHYSTSDMYHASEPDVYLNRAEFPVDEPVWFSPDDVAQGNDTVLKQALAWISSLTHAHDVTLDRYYGRPGKDSVTVTAVLANPLHHTATISAVMSDGAAVHDSVLFYNDGLHGDGGAGDSISGARLLPPNLESNFNISVETRDISQGTSRRLPNVALLSTAGPLVLTNIDYLDHRDMGYCEVLPYVQNVGVTAPFVGGTISLSCADSGVSSVVPAMRTLNTIVAGASDHSNGGFTINYDPEKASGSFTLHFGIGLNGHACWDTTYKLTVTSVPEEKPIPLTYALGQNYPNPFNPKTVLSSQLPVASHVKLVIYDLLGREVAVLVNERRIAGYYQDSFDASGLASGVYIYRMTAGSFVQSRKMLLIR